MSSINSHSSTGLGNDEPGNGSLGSFILSSPDMPWLDDAACGDVPLDQLNMFFVEAGRTIKSTTIALCKGCPVRARCLEYAYQHDIVSGYFGGVSPGRRRSVSFEEALAEISVP